MLRFKDRLAMVAALVAATVSTAVPAQAVDVPAYGVITITSDGVGVVPTWTYDPALWACRTDVVGNFFAPTEVTVTCDADQGQSFICPVMILTTQTRGGRAGGSASCTGSLDTGIVSGIDQRTARGNLGRAYSVRCRAYGGGLPMTPPYTITCSEPGLPELDG